MLVYFGSEMDLYIFGFNGGFLVPVVVFLLCRLH